MCRFYKIIFLLICTITIMVSCAEVAPKPDANTEEQFVRLSNVAAITEGKMERTKRSLLNYLLFGLYEYFDYSNEPDSEEDEKYLICRNCSIIIKQSDDKGTLAIQSTQPPTPVPIGNNASNGGDVSVPSTVSMPSEIINNTAPPTVKTSES